MTKMQFKPTHTTVNMLAYGDPQFAIERGQENPKVSVSTDLDIILLQFCTFPPKKVPYMWAWAPVGEPTCEILNLIEIFRAYMYLLNALYH